MPRRLFTPAEANSALEVVRPLAERLVAVRARMRELVTAQGRLVSAIGGNGAGHAANDLGTAQAELAELADRAGSLVAELEAAGAVVKDLDAGLLDFPALRGTEEVELCWQVGEDAVAYWHPLDVGFRGRKPVDWGE